MRILKYLFLLLLLASIGLTVFVLTQEGDYDVSRSRIIKSPKIIAFDYINDYRNWETFGAWMETDNTLKFDYSSNTIGIGGSYSWEGKNNKGNMKTIYVKENDSISQLMEYNGSKSKVFWTFKDTVGGTKVTWRTIGKMNLAFKVYTFFKGGINSFMGNLYEKSLYNLDKTLVYEMKTYNINVNGIVNKKGSFYLKQTITCKLKSLTKNIRILLPRMVNFSKKNNIKTNGNPFVLYEKFDLPNELVTFSVCIPVHEKINIMPGSDMSSGELKPFTAVKTTLTGDYSHLKEAKEKTLEYIKTNNLTENPTGHSIDIFTKTFEDVKNPSKWVTEIYIPVFPKKVEMTNSSEDNTSESKPIVNQDSTIQ